MPIESYNVYNIEIKKKKGIYYAHITYELEVPGSLLHWDEKITSQVVAGIDVNVDRIAASILTIQGNLLETKTFYCHEMEYVSSNRRKNISGEVAKAIIDYLLRWNVGTIILEDLKIRQTHDTNKKVNRTTHAFANKKIQSALISRGLKNGFKIKRVNPAYTSCIGKFKYSKQYGLSVHEAASFVIGRRGIDLEESVPKELLKILKDVVKPVLVRKVGSMEESEKETKKGKQRIKFLLTLIKNIENFKKNHYWKIWNVVHKTLHLKNQELQLKEV
jgi:IS605 OrfB family transposase